MVEVGSFIGNFGTSIVDMFLYAILGLMIAGTIMLGLWAMWFYSQFKIQVEVTERTTGNLMVRMDKAREFKDRKTKKIGWQLLNTKGDGPLGRKVIPIPDTKFVDLTPKGRQFVRLFKEQGDNYQAWHPQVENRVEGSKEQYFLSSGDRAILADEVTRSETLYKKQSIGDKILQIMPYIAIVFIIFGVVMLLDQMSETFQDISNQAAKLEEQRAEQVERIAQLNERMINFLEGKQVIVQESDETDPGGQG